jgi:tRNA A37 methylthiotransferase MiaB
LIKDYKITKVHGFPFSPHKFGEDVPAGIFPNQIDEKVKKARLNRLLSLAEEVRNDFINSQK